jgi:hypothetical protein
MDDLTRQGKIEKACQDAGIGVFSQHYFLPP